jgi:hypothetical protein
MCLLQPVAHTALEGVQQVERENVIRVVMLALESTAQRNNAQVRVTFVFYHLRVANVRRVVEIPLSEIIFE